MYYTIFVFVKLFDVPTSKYYKIFVDILVLYKKNTDSVVVFYFGSSKLG